jgi:hypothetical protein
MSRPSLATGDLVSTNQISPHLVVQPHDAAREALHEDKPAHDPAVPDFGDGSADALVSRRQFQAAGEVPPIHLAANVPHGNNHPATLESRYAGRIRRAA